MARRPVASKRSADGNGVKTADRKRKRVSFYTLLRAAGCLAGLRNGSPAIRPHSDSQPIAARTRNPKPLTGTTAEVQFRIPHSEHTSAFQLTTSIPVPDSLAVEASESKNPNMALGMFFDIAGLISSAGNSWEAYPGARQVSGAPWADGPLYYAPIRPIHHDTRRSDNVTCESMSPHVTPCHQIVPCALASWTGIRKPETLGQRFQDSTVLPFNDPTVL